MKKSRNLRIDGDRLWNSIMEVAKIGATDKGGSKRLALTDLDRDCRDLFIKWCKEAGCNVSVDNIGNIFARRQGKNPESAAVMTGSHLDTQPTGGRFDGVFGVLAGLEIIRTLNDVRAETERPIDLVVWTNEEGSRFAPAMVASAVFSGKYDLAETLLIKDQDGATIGEELERIGYSGDEKVGERELYAYLEAHIEQGPILESEKKDIGVVTGAQAQRWYEITLTGVESHAGPTPMDIRKDALLGSAQVINLVNQIGHKYLPNSCATVGMLEVYPNSRNVIPGQVFFTIDFRHQNDDQLDCMDKDVRKGISSIAESIGLTFEINEVLYLPPIIFDDTCINSVRKSAIDNGYSWQEINSGAGHDACNIAAIAPTSMIFIPCIDGISHNEKEDAKPEWVTSGGQVLLTSVTDLAKII